MKHWLIALALLLGGAATAAAQDWDAGDDPLQALTRELHELLDKGERERLADPWYLKDLRNLVNRYYRPWTRAILADDFTGPGPAPDAPWQVVAGDFRIDWRYGLRSVVEPPPAAASQSQGTQQGQAVKQLFGAILNQALQGGQQGQSQTTAAAAPRGPALLVAPVAITNAFAVAVELTARPMAGGASFGIAVYQGQDARAGYRLAFAPDASGALRLSLLRTSAWGGAAVVDQAAQAVVLAPEVATRVDWTRKPDGEMEVAIDGEAVIRVVDRGYTGAFDGLAVTVEQGDIALRQVTVEGT